MCQVYETSGKPYGQQVVAFEQEGCASHACAFVFIFNTRAIQLTEICQVYRYYTLCMIFVVIERNS